MCTRRTIQAALIILTLVAPAASGQADTYPFADKVDRREVEIWSDGTRLAGDLFYPKDRKEGEKMPAIVLCHGWGGTKSHLIQTYAPKFAAGGFVVLAFDYRGWGESDSRLVLRQKMPTPDENGEATVKVQIVREVVDPVDELRDIQSALDFIEGEEMVDTNRIGIWGTSFGGGLVVWTAAHDKRVKCIVSQVGAMNGRVAAELMGGVEGVHKRAIKRARGELGPMPQNEIKIPGLRGTPYLSRMVEYAPVDFAHLITVPILLIDAENEELMDIKEHSAKVYSIVKDNVPAKYHVEPGIKHYGIYRERYEIASNMGLDWFKEHLQ